MVVTKIKGKIVLIDSQLARVIGDNKVEVYRNENEIAANNKPTMTYIASEAKKYIGILLQKVSLTGRDQDIKELNSILAK